MLNEVLLVKSYRGLAATLLAACALIGCGDAGSTAPLTPGNVSVASKLATVAVAVAAAPEGAAFFDNFLPCPRRGVVDYRNSDHGRFATFSGCDVGDGIVIDGTSELRWTTPGADRTHIATIDVPGPLHVTTVGGAPLDVGGITISNIAFSAASNGGAFPAIERFLYASSRVTIAGETFTPNALGDPARVFVTGLSLDAIPPVPVDALTDADMKRLAYHVAVGLADILFNETEETQRGNHIHTFDCGTIRVTVDTARNLPTLDMNWNACDVGQGLIMSGTFTVGWTQFDAQNGALAMRVAGSMTVGGGLPRTTLTSLDWSLSGIKTYPANARMTMQIVGDKQRSFSINLVLDD
jgi:hypothetical protein